MSARIAIDGRMALHTGIGRYLRCLLSEWSRTGEAGRFLCVVNPSQGLGWIPKGAEIHVLPREIPVYSLAEQTTLARLLARLPWDLLHAPHFNVPWLLGAERPFVATIHDLIYLVSTEGGRTPLHAWAARALLRRTAARAARILTVSEFSGREIARLLGAAGVRVVHHGADHLPEGDPSAPRDAATLLYVGNHLPHKNLPFLMGVLAALARKVPHARLEVTGSRSRHTAAAAAAAERHGVADRVRWLGAVDDAALAAAYRRATVLVLPSLHEGFGFPAVEAMRLGLPVAATDATALPEVVGDAGLLLPPSDAPAWTDALAALLADGARRRALAERGILRARALTWAAAARATAACYEEVLQGRPESG